MSAVATRRPEERQSGHRDASQRAAWPSLARVGAIVLFSVALAYVALYALRASLRHASDDEDRPTLPVSLTDTETSEETDGGQDRPTGGPVPLPPQTDDLRAVLDGQSQTRLSEVREAWPHSEEQLRRGLIELVEAGEVRVFPFGDFVKVAPAD